MLGDRISRLRILNLACDIAVTSVAFSAACIAEAYYHQSGSFHVLRHQLTLDNLLIVCILWGILIYREKGTYIYRTKPYHAILRDVAGVVILGNMLFVAWLFAVNEMVFDRSFFATFIALDFALLYCLRVTVLVTLHFIRRKGRNNQTVMVIGTGSLAKEAVDKLKDHPEWGYTVIGLLDWQQMSQLWRYRDIPLIGSINELSDIIRDRQVDYVIFAAEHQHLDKIESAFAICEEMGAQACLVADFLSTSIARKKITEFLGRPAIVYSTTPGDKVQITAKHVLDRVCATAGLVMTFPILLAIALLIRLTSKGPVFFKQERCGLNGKRFRLIKFRTMVEDAEVLRESLRHCNEMDGPAFKIASDPRITPVGRLLRRSSLDELPQLLNVVRGDMSLVGPRPPMPQEVHEYDRWQRRKLSMKPGITCLWQVGGRNNTTFDEWMKLDLKYIDNWSLWLDAKILIKTIPAVINATGK
jgi:exopolysaccharide biosynthesis polyprenyl glycosylphosphotransferase